MKSRANDALGRLHPEKQEVVLLSGLLRSRDEAYARHRAKEHARCIGQNVLCRERDDLCMEVFVLAPC